MYTHRDYQQIVSSLPIKVNIYDVNTQENDAKEDHLLLKDAVALWDTGAVRSVITKRLAKKWKLKQVDIPEKYDTAKGLVTAKIYNVALQLPGGGFFPALAVAAMDLSSCDFLIGMDVIQQGKFHVDLYNNKTILSYKTEETLD